MQESAIILEAVYNNIFNKDANFSTFTDRLQVQKTVYLLQEMGLNIGDYGYRWYKHGPYSQKVQDDTFFISNNLPLVRVEASKLRFNETAIEIMEKFKRFFAYEREYNDSEWLEAIASIHYLLNYKMSLPDYEKVITKLKELKPYLNNESANKRAWEIALGI